MTAACDSAGWQTSNRLLLDGTIAGLPDDATADTLLAAVLATTRVGT